MPTTVVWREELAEAQEHAQEAGRTVLVYLWAPG